MSISTCLRSFLDETQIPYSVMTHTRTYTAQGAAAKMASARLANDVSVAFGQPSELGGIEPRIGPREDGKVSRRRHGELRFVAELSGVSGLLGKGTQMPSPSPAPFSC